MNSEKVTLVVCDGMGLSPEAHGNAFYQAATPTFDYLLQNYPAMRLLAAGTEVGLDSGEPGNSEVGHLALGTGQVLPQAFQIISASVKSETYKNNRNFLTAMVNVKKNPGSTLHLVGIVSAGGVHGHIDHLIALIQMAKENGVERVAVHAVTDGRDSPPRVVLQDIGRVEAALKDLPFGVVATVGGRYYAMDRDANWDRTDTYYWSMFGKSVFQAPSCEDAVQQGYGRGEGDETLQPTVITDKNGAPLAAITPHDTIIFTNYRPDRIRQLVTRAIMTPQPLLIVTMTNYFLSELPASHHPETLVLNAYPLPAPKGTLSQVLADNGKTQLHIAETEKYAHITYFFNGHEEQRKAREEWLLIPSIKIDTFSRAPEMSAVAITDACLQSKQAHPADFTTLNYANMDMVGHTGVFEAAKVAVTFVDGQLKRLVDWAESHNEWLLITADHGNVEQMLNPVTGEVDKEHTTNPVPFLIVHPSLKNPRRMDKYQLAVMSNMGILADVAPTVLEIMGVKKSAEMVGSSLLKQLH